MITRPLCANARINGVNTPALLNALVVIGEDPSLGQSRFAVRSQWLDGGHTRSTAKEFIALGHKQRSRVRPLATETDVPFVFGGGEQAMDPLEQLLAALASSVVATLVWQAVERGIHIEAIDTDVEGDIDLGAGLGLHTGGRAGLTAIRVRIAVAAECEESQLDALVADTARHSPIFDTVAAGTPITLIRQPGS